MPRQTSDREAIEAEIDRVRPLGLDELPAQGNTPGADRPRRLKPGTVLLREYQGERHTVTVVPNGYVWHETTYASLSTIARAITGTRWNGPRFFGLRSGGGPRASSEAANVSRSPDNKRCLIRAPKSLPAGSAPPGVAPDIRRGLCEQIPPASGRGAVSNDRPYRASP
jgi:hypothetical protein